MFDPDQGGWRGRLYRRFYMQKALFHYPWRGTGFRRRYLLGCLYAFLRAGFRRTFYDLGKAGYWGPQTAKQVDWHFEAVRKQMKERGEARAAERQPDRIDVS